ncbi:solute carrier family 52, riboflavin transporter, member 3-B-like [Mercenaria mercenaria]|uniref:solute carrier family 52, riboflavin transporter, member 3-B-like n=1 Tax=Mercenaria mercenaria TaxID=6596 RepID=UPI00234EC7BA|nr:solute carrier family 52, riboflavin transporter, member 3-B-like [Mercenaria mercenaria]XP_045194017.2 solute carrier family 52, riboflavin transporter, member 3-B-like [Mercenaria mercenaria]XP_053400927.1 solute carrier family 52, riboflavin transporter, member 3-B-like [Mercenaria mercenaria]
MEMKCCSDVKLLVCIIIVLFGMGSWIAINGIWVELPILVDQLPEGWNLPSYMTVVIQIANVGPIAYTIWSFLNPKSSFEKPVVLLMVFVGSAASLLLAFFWMETSVVGGVEHSTALLILMFFLSLVDCTSSVVFLPFMNTFKPGYMTSYYIGEGFSGLVPSLVALGQGVGQVECQNKSSVNATSNVTEYSIQAVYLPSKFPVEDFFLFVFAMMVTCGIAFILLNYMHYCKTEHVNNNKKNLYEMDINSTASSTQKFVETTGDENIDFQGNKRSENEGISSKKMSTTGYLYFLFLIAWVNALTNGVLPSVQSYACLPYGTESYHLAVTLSNIANPVACFIAFFLPVGSAGVIGLISLVGTLVSAYIMVLAAGSPTPVLVESSAGGILVVIAYVAVYLTLTFTKVSVATLFRFEGRKGLLWCGAITQLGSAVGAAVMFVIVNVNSLFQQKYPCT